MKSPATVSSFHADEALVRQAHALAAGRGEALHAVYSRILAAYAAAPRSPHHLCAPAVSPPGTRVAVSYSADTAALRRAKAAARERRATLTQVLADGLARYIAEHADDDPLLS